MRTLIMTSRSWRSRQTIARQALSVVAAAVLLVGCAASQRYGADCGLPDGQWCGIFGHGPSGPPPAAGTDPLLLLGRSRGLDPLLGIDHYSPPPQMPSAGVTNCYMLGSILQCRSY